MAEKMVGWISMPASAALHEFVESLPRLEIDEPTLVTRGGGDHGWLLVVPKEVK